MFSELLGNMMQKEKDDRLTYSFGSLQSLYTYRSILQHFTGSETVFLYWIQNRSNIKYLDNICDWVRWYRNVIWKGTRYQLSHLLKHILIVFLSNTFHKTEAARSHLFTQFTINDLLYIDLFSKAVNRSCYIIPTHFFTKTYREQNIQGKNGDPSRL